ncbi:hypothetical protein EV421DRAFT_1743118 [Armillaria borealis]|uniref:Uncharacterized protein n=1 Tax=Armillaria borealis TaxID=47425 RepID=A0AA39MF43_9AGAR|nr:hypothetical protein EV421DRAFT_1743118 [Armillaria borealis]
MSKRQRDEELYTSLLYMRTGNRADVGNTGPNPSKQQEAVLLFNERYMLCNGAEYLDLASQIFVQNIEMAMAIISVLSNSKDQEWKWKYTRKIIDSDLIAERRSVSRQRRRVRAQNREEDGKVMM